MRRPELVAELSCNHLGSTQQALDLVDGCAAGADSIKVQVWTKNRMCLDPNYTMRNGTWGGRRLRDLYDEAYTPWAMVEAVFERARKLDLKPFASVFDTDALTFLESLDCPRYKIASFELTDLPLIQAVAETGKPLIMSTGMATDDEIREAVTVARRAGCTNLTLLHCVSSYPAPPSSYGLLDMDRLGRLHGCQVGLSDHTMGMGVPIAAAVLGAAMIEKHVTLDRNDGGPDATFSMNINELAQLSQELDRATQACANPPYPRGSDPNEQPMRKLRRSLYWAKPIYAGERIGRAHLTTARPALGMEPGAMTILIGQVATQNHHPNTPVTKV